MPGQETNPPGDLAHQQPPGLKVAVALEATWTCFATHGADGPPAGAKEHRHLQHRHQNTVSYSAAISACEKAGNWSVMLLLLEEMQLSGCGEGLSEQVRPNVVTCSACIAACEKGREWRRALELLRCMGRLEVRGAGGSHGVGKPRLEEAVAAGL
eukprot:Skav229987  [mRNA]  locus=scaffold1837:98903:101212:+ [translate_table: standard]